MKTLEMAQATAPLAEDARTLNSEATILTVNGRPVAALVPIANADWETISLSGNPDFLALIEHSRKRQKEEGGISREEMRRRLAAAPSLP